MKWDIFVTTLCFTCFIPFSGHCAPAEHEHTHDGHTDSDHHLNSDHHGETQGHVHGKAQLLIVMEGSALQVQFESPAANVVGFEHPAQTQQEKSALNRAQQLLAKPTQLFEFKPKPCQLIDYSTDLTGVETGGLSHDHHFDDQSSEGENRRNENNGEQNHKEITAIYHYRCDQPQKLTSLTTSLTEQFQAIERLEVQWLVNGRQAATTLDNRQHDITFR